MKTCTQCGESKEISEYHKMTRSPDGHKTECKVCMCARARARKYGATDKSKSAALTKRYGITIETFRRILETQGGHCATCGSTEDLCLDHRKAPHKVRGVLCKKCNFAVGLINENPATAVAIATYLEKHS